MRKPFLPLLFFGSCAALATGQGPGLKCGQVEDEIRCEATALSEFPYAPVWELYALPDGTREDKAKGWTVVLYPAMPAPSLAHSHQYLARALKLKDAA